MPKVTPVEVFGDLSPEDHELAQEFETETAVALAEPEPVDFTELENFIAAYGANRLASPASWAIAVGIDSSLLHNALRDGELSVISRSSAGDNHRRESGLKAADFLMWLKRRSIRCVLGEVARAALNASPAEAVRLRESWSLGSAVEALGIDFDALRLAIQKGHIRSDSDPNAASSVGHISPDSLLRWLESQSMQIKLSLDSCGHLLRARHAQSGSTEEPAGQSVIDEALDVLTDQLLTDEADEVANLKAMRKHYVTILRRRGEPIPGDARDLAEIAKQLGIGRAEMERDVAVLEAADALAHQVEQIEHVTAELEAAGEASTELKSRHKIETDEARARLRNAQTAHAIAVRSPFELAAIKVARPELFE